MTKRAFIILGFSIIVNILGNRTYAADPTFVTTFNSISIYWLPADPDTGSAKAQSIQYSELGSGIWKSAQAMAWDSSNGAGFRGYRGSIVFLKAGTSYDIDMLIGGESGSAFRDTVTTWAETDNWTISATTDVNGAQSGTYVISTGGSGGYRLYDFTDATFAASGADTNIVVRSTADSIIIRGASPTQAGALATTLSGAGRFGIYIEAGATDGVIEYLDISGFGTADTNVSLAESGIHFANNSTERWVIQRNKVHSPNGTSLRWLHRKDNLSAAIHPGGPSAISMNNPASNSNSVVRYNTISGGGDNWGSNVQRLFKDGITTGPDQSQTGGFKDTDIYGNSFSYIADDAVENEGRGMNVRLWHNYTNHTYISYAFASVSMGPSYLWRNIADNSRRADYYDSTDTSPNGYDRGPFLKGGESGSNTGWVFVYHNTILQDTSGGVTYGRGHKHFLKDDGGPYYNYTSRNNLVTLNAVATQQVMDDGSNDASNTADYDMIQGNYNCCGSGTGYNPSNDTSAYPAFNVSGTGYPTVASGDFSLQNGSTGEEAGLVLAEMFQHNDNTDPAIGAMENTQNALEFGYTAYLNLQGGGGAVSGRYLLIDRTK